MLTALILSTVLSSPQGAFYQNDLKIGVNGQFYVDATDAAVCEPVACQQTCEEAAGPYCMVTNAICQQTLCYCTFYCVVTTPGGQHRPGDGIPKLEPKMDE